MSLLASIFVFKFSILVISNSVQHAREDFRQVGGVALGKRGGVWTNQTSYPWSTPDPPLTLLQQWPIHDFNCVINKYSILKLRLQVQWGPSNPDTLGTRVSGRISKVSFCQGLILWCGCGLSLKSMVYYDLWPCKWGTWQLLTERLVVLAYF